MNWIRRTWALLFGALVLQLLFNPCMEIEFGAPGRWILIALNSLVVIAIIHKLATQRYQLIIALALGLPTLIFFWLPTRPILDQIMLVLNGLLYIYAIAALLPVLLRARNIGLDELFGAASLYIMIGLTWALLYAFLEVTVPGSFHVVSTADPDRTLALGDMTYYSFVTLTTLGYGDIIPLSCQARSLAILEAISGLLCLSVVVARMISLHAAHIIDKDKPL